MKRQVLCLLLIAACSSKKEPKLPPLAVPPVAAVRPDAGAAPPPINPSATSDPEALAPQPKLAAATQALIPHDGVMFATRTTRGTGDVLLLYQVQPTGLREVYRQPNTSVSTMGWLDRKTLVLYSEGSNGEGIVQRIVDGKPVPAIAVPLEAWKIAAPVGIAALHLYQTGEVWLQRCVRRADAVVPDSECTATAALRVDQATPLLAKALPATAELVHRVVDVHRGWYRFDSSTAPTIAAPPKHKLEMFTVKGAKRKNFMATYDKGWRCSRPPAADATANEPDVDATFEWPYGSEWIELGNITTFRPSSVRWVTAVPARYVVEGTATNMLGESWQLSALFYACENAPVAAAAYLGHNIWAEMGEISVEGGVASADPSLPSDGPAPLIHGEWKLFLGETLIGTGFGGDAVAVQPE